MIYGLQRRFIVVCAISIFLVISIMFVSIALLNLSSMNRALDMLTDGLSQGQGKFPESFDKRAPMHEDPKKNSGFIFITPETRFATRHFAVWIDKDGEISDMNTEFIYSVDEQSAKEYASRVFERKESRGWISNYRYKISEQKDGFLLIFVDGSINRGSFLQTLLISAAVLVLSALGILLLIVILSKRAVKPVAQSYEKQKQFITDANHELKTPLTLILANLDIAEDELGKNEWLDDIRTEGIRMTEMVNQLVELTRMDEESGEICRCEVALGASLEEFVLSFATLAQSKNIDILLDVDKSVTVCGDESMLRRLVGILMDNAVKYCDAGGQIKVSLKKKRNVIFSVENTYAALDSVALDRIFDRFYRADKARSYPGGHGIGLSTAKAIVQKHRGEIIAYKKDATTIGIKAILK